MKTIRTAGGSFLTGDEIADAVTAYGLALARARDLNVVDIPFVVRDGSIQRAQFRIGWLIGTVVTDDQVSTDELIDVDTIFGLLAKARSLAVSRSSVASGWSFDEQGSTNWDEFI